jgi:hypothetical protein
MTIVGAGSAGFGAWAEAGNAMTSRNGSAVRSTEDVMPYLALFRIRNAW